MSPSRRLGLNIVPAMALAAVAGANLFAGAVRAATYHVDFDHGHDEANGLSAASAWRHSPGDPAATSLPARTALRPGDVIRFAANVRYRGAIAVTASGSKAAPIVFTGEGADDSAVIDGSDPASEIRPCRSAVDCGGAANWRDLVRVASSVPLSADSALFADRGLMRPAQSPNPKDGFYRDEPGDMAPVDGHQLEQGRLPLPHATAATLAGGGGRVALWVRTNLVVYRPILGLDGDSALFDPSGLRFYTDRPDRAAVIDHVGLIDEPGEYAVLPGGRSAVAMLPQGATRVTVATGRGGFALGKGASHLTFRNLRFENMADGGRLTGGIAILADKTEGSDLTIEKNNFHAFSMPEGQGPIILRGVSDLRIVGNRIDTISLGSGMRLGGAHMTIEDNRISHLGRTGIMLIGVDDATARRNVISDILGVHGNGLSAYLDDHDIRVLANTVTDAKQPVTFEGSGAPAARANNLLFANNLLIATPGALGALISWGGHTRGVTIRNNVILGGQIGLRLNGTDRDLAIADNIVSGLYVDGPPPTDWRLAGNAWTALSAQQTKDHLHVADDLAALTANPAGVLRGLEKVCSVIMQRTLPRTPGEAWRSVGAGFTCR